VACVARLQALSSVASAFVTEGHVPSELRPAVVEHMVLVHQSVRRFSVQYAEELRRHNYVTVCECVCVCVCVLQCAVYTGVDVSVMQLAACHLSLHQLLPICTQALPLPSLQPKNFLDYISTFQRSLASRGREIADMSTRLTTGLAKLMQASTEVDTLQRELSAARAVVQAATCECDQLLEVRQNLHICQRISPAAEGKHSVLQASMNVKSQMC
jgi:dynein heavy chain, axonemal